MLWGFSEALDMHKEYVDQQKTKENPLELNILLFGVGDPRHILKSLAKSYNHNTKLNFYIGEGCLASLARDLLLLSIALEAGDEISTKGKTHLFMDIFGNSLLRASSYGYVCSKARHLLQVITDMDFARSVMPSISFDRLKYAERDGLEEVFQFWRDRPGHQFDIGQCWVERVRRDLGQRYDSRMGAFDWDLQMKLKDYGAGQICSQEYKHWRDTGVAFVFPEYEHSCPNKTLAVGVSKNGTGYRHRGFVGDIHVGPFCQFGLTSDDPALHRSNHGNNEFRATDVTERNVYQLMYEIQESRAYAVAKGDVHQYGSSQLAIGKPMVVQNGDMREDELKKYDRKLLRTPNLSVTFLSMDDLLKLADRKELMALFHVVFVAQMYFPLFKQEFQSVFSEETVVLFETKQLSVLRKDDISKFLKTIRDFAKGLNLNPITNFNINLPIPVARFKTF